jgi:hypothetical protein
MFTPTDSPKTTAHKAKPHAAFSAAVPINVDEIFEIIEPMEIIPGSAAFSAPFVVKINRALLNIGDVLPVFIESDDPGLFECVELVGVCQMSGTPHIDLDPDCDSNFDYDPDHVSDLGDRHESSSSAVSLPDAHHDMSRK